MSILKLQPAYKDYLWGGDKLVKHYNKKFDGDCLAETWELSCHEDGLSIISEGENVGLSLKEYIELHGKKVLGSNCAIFDEFPILIKLIDAKKDLSIQVHPNNIYALDNEKQYGKSEMWYVLDAEPNSYIYYGFKNKITKHEYERRISNNTLQEVLNKYPVRKGDCIYIPSGTVHAICKGLVIAEIQQNSNVTYRVFDYGRKDINGNTRELHIKKAIDVSELEFPRINYNFGDHLLRCMYFTVDLYETQKTINVNNESFLSILIIDGEGTITNNNQIVNCKKGDSLFVTSCSGICEISENLKILCTQIGTI